MAGRNWRYIKTPVKSMNLKNNPTKPQLQTLLASCDDNAGPHVIWVGTNGEVYAEALPEGLTPAGLAESKGNRIKFRYETFDTGNEYVGKSASHDPMWIDELYGKLLRDWASDARGYIDT
jgi:hypothetical protein